jgi:hypothetical protein
MARPSVRRRIHDRPAGRPGVDRDGGPAAGGPEHVDVAGRERRRRPGPPGGPPAGGPDGRVEALLAERALHDGERHRRPAVVVGRCHLAGRPAEQPGLDLRGQQERDLPGARRSARLLEAAGPELVGEPGGQLGEAAGLERGRGHDVMWAHGILFGGSVRLAGPVPCRSPQRAGDAGRRAPGHAQDAFGPRSGTRSWSRVSLGCDMTDGNDPAPGPGCQGPPASRPFIGSQPSCASADAGRVGLIDPIRLGSGPTQRNAWSCKLRCLRPPEGTPAGTGSGTVS